MKFVLFLFSLFLFSTLLSEQAPTDKSKSDPIQGFANYPLLKSIVVDLRSPSFCEGVLQTEKGGTISGPDVRIQARKIIYTKKMEGENPICHIEAEGDLLLEFGEYIFVGDRLEYDFVEHTGVIYQGKTAKDSWFLGGRVIYLLSDCRYYIEDAFLTTSENVCNDWQLEARCTNITEDHQLHAQDVKLRILQVPVFWLPSFRVNLDTLCDIPIRFYMRWGGRLGTRFGLIYEVFSWNRLKTYLRLDYRTKRGFGLGFETYYRSEDHKEELETINYIAQENSLVHPHQNIRYRFQGLYSSLLYDDCLSVNMSWDKLSDKDMATDYNDRGLELDTAGLTQLHLRQAGTRTVSNFFTRVRINSFQTLKQELPTLETRFLPVSVGSTGIIADLNTKMSYLDFRYSHGLKHVHDYRSSRVEVSQKFYRPFPIGDFVLTPSLGVLGIFYGTSPHRGGEKWLALGQFGLELNTRLHQYYKNCKHVIIPYINYTYYTYPTVSPNHHFIFDIDDGWYRLNTMRIGARQSFYQKPTGGCIHRYFYSDIYAYAFFNTPTIHAIVPKIYGLFVISPLPTLRYTVDTAWDIQRTRLDHFNIRVGTTLSPDMAIAIEWRYRDAFDFRKVDHTNFILDSFRPVHELLHSPLSDRRDTLLTHFFYRFHPNWALQFQSRQGWNRKFEPKYTEFEVDLFTTLRSAWKVKLYYRHREDDDRFAINISLNLLNPCCDEPIIPCFEF